MANVERLVAHFKQNKLPQSALHAVRRRGGGPMRTYFKVQSISPAQQTVDQAKALNLLRNKNKKPVNRRRKSKKPTKKSKPKTAPKRKVKNVKNVTRNKKTFKRNVAKRKKKIGQTKRLTRDTLS